jgi:hypothetical protein
MAQLSRSGGIILVLIVGFIIQLLFSFADLRDTPNKVAVEFSKAYFNLDKSMAKKICKKRLVSDDIDVIDEYLYVKAKEAKDRGFNINFMKNKLYHIETETISRTDTEAQIRVTGKIRISMNPVYPVVAKLFDIGSTHEIDETLSLIKEDGKWKVCGDAFSLPAV